MTREALSELLSRRPFEPIRLKMSSGEVHEILHHEFAMLAKSGLVIVKPDVDGGPTDRMEYCSYLHIAGVETASWA